MPVLGLEVPKRDVDVLFNQWDPDGSGSISYHELRKLLQGGSGASTAAAPPRRGAAPGRKPMTNAASPGSRANGRLPGT